ncbi:hypothetical protein ABH925_002086 [Streptacidiphilus sp. EB129]|jgi:hypothetical protein
MNARHRLARRRLQERRRARPHDPELLRLLRTAAAIGWPGQEPDPSARRADVAGPGGRFRGTAADPLPVGPRIVGGSTAGPTGRVTEGGAR